MRGRIQNRTTTITHPEYGDVEWIDTSVSGDRIQIRYWSPSDGGFVTQWVDWTLPRKIEPIEVS